jgi:hypothetical protein
MDAPYIYYIPIYPDDDCSEALMHLFTGEQGLDKEIVALLEALDRRESNGEAVNYIHEFEEKLKLRRVSVHQVPRHQSRYVPITT